MLDWPGLARGLIDAATAERLVAVIRGQLAGEPALVASDISVTMRRDIAILSGTVPTWADVVAAGFLTAAVDGLGGVVNDLQAADRPPLPTVDGAPTASPAPRTPRTPRTAAAAKLATRLFPPLTAEERTADVVIIGGGVCGCTIARELTRYDVKVTLVEREWDVACGASRANNGAVHPGIDPPPGSFKARLNVRGAELYPNLARQLDFAYRRCGLLGVVTDPDELFAIEIIKLRAEDNGVPGVETLYGLEAVRALEPHVSEQAVGAFYAPTMALVSPFAVTLAHAENAVANGARLLLGTTVTGLALRDGAVTGVITDRGEISCRLVINAAGVHADDICAMADAREFTIHPRRGELVIFDPAHVGRGHGQTAVSPFGLNIDPHTKGGAAMMTIDGNPEWGPTAVEIPDKEDHRADRAGLERVLTKFQPLFPDYPARESVIAYFAGVRAATYHEDFHIGPSRFVPGLYNVGGIQSPGLAAAPAIAELVGGEVRTLLSLKERPDWRPERRQGTRLAGADRPERERLVATAPEHGRVICRCETVSEAELVAAIRGRVPALTVDALKRRTRIGMGRCQGGFCLPRLVGVLARELGVPPLALSKGGIGSELFAGSVGEGRESMCASRPMSR